MLEGILTFNIPRKLQYLILTQLYTRHLVSFELLFLGFYTKVFVMSKNIKKRSVQNETVFYAREQNIHFFIIVL